MKGYFMAKNIFVAEVTFNVRKFLLLLNQGHM